jgi:aspartyl aminopeptidase
MARNKSADDLIGFLNQSPSPYHAVEEMACRLSEAGISALEETAPWSLAPGSSAYVIRGGGSLVAFRVPKEFSHSQPSPFHIMAAHTDSPGLRLKPHSPQPTFGYRQWGVEVYGGVLYNSWLDRDLGIAGRVYRVGGDRRDEKRIRLEEHPIRIPQLAIHLDRTVNDQGLMLNPQKHLVPILGQVAGKTLEALLETVTEMPFGELTFDLCLYDRTPACYGGVTDEFIYSARLDNLAMCHATLSAFLDAPCEKAIQVIALFDHEEVGSVSAQGSESNLLAALLERVGWALGLNREAWLALLPKSFLISADMAHGLHPNYPDRHEPDHFPLLNEGVVVKSNTGMRYASDSFTTSRFLEWARRADVKTQRFLSRADLSCGSTVGPGLSAQLGIPTLDVGTAMLSMHSVREMCGSEDTASMIAVLREYLRG